jgi:hypothetical protein
MDTTALRFPPALSPATAILLVSPLNNFAQEKTLGQYLLQKHFHLLNKAVLECGLRCRAHQLYLLKTAAVATVYGAIFDFMASSQLASSV